MSPFFCKQKRLVWRTFENVVKEAYFWFYNSVVLAKAIGCRHFLKQLYLLQE